eukprot:2364357-Rhodomonas_salina.2
MCRSLPRAANPTPRAPSRECSTSLCDGGVLQFNQGCDTSYHRFMLRVCFIGGLLQLTRLAAAGCVSSAQRSATMPSPLSSRSSAETDPRPFPVVPFAGGRGGRCHFWWVCTLARSLSLSPFFPPLLPLSLLPSPPPSLSASFPTQDVAKFQDAYGTILKGNMDGLKKPEKVLKKKQPPKDKDAA